MQLQQGLYRYGEEEEEERRCCCCCFLITTIRALTMKSFENTLKKKKKKQRQQYSTAQHSTAQHQGPKGKRDRSYHTDLHYLFHAWRRQTISSVNPAEQQSEAQRKGMPLGLLRRTTDLYSRKQVRQLPQCNPCSGRASWHGSRTH